MNTRSGAVLLAALTLAACGSDSPAPTTMNTTPDPSTTLSFFVSSTTSTTGNLGGLAGADARCQSLAAAAGAGARTWHAYLSTSTGDARSRIGNGPWVNSKGVVLARNLEELHARKGDPQVFLDEKGRMINGQWTGSPTPNEHDILTGSTADGRLMAGATCADWTSAATTVTAQVGHADGLGPGGDTSGSLSSWNSAHANQDCSNTAPRGGAGRIYCFAVN